MVDKKTMTHADKHQQLRDLPGVDHILELIKTDDRFFELPRKVILESIRSVLEKIRQDILGETHPKIEHKDIIDQSLELAGRKIKNRLSEKL